MKRVFIDTNVFLAFYEVTKDDLEKLTEAFKLAAEQEIQFVTTQQVKSEFARRRSAIVAKSLEHFSELRVPALPAMAKGIAQMEAFVQARKNVAQCHKSLANALIASAREGALDADKAVQNLLTVSMDITPTEDMVGKAALRIDCGNPPGKRGSLGDAINWECLLNTKKIDGDLIIVSQDRDFRDPLAKQEIDTFLRDEWKTKRGTEVTLFHSLSDFIKEYFGHVDIKSFEQVDAKVSALAGSESFAETHSAISELASITYFTPKQAVRLVQALDGNGQVHWIFSDDDVRRFFSSLLESCGDKMDVYEVNYLEYMLAYDGDGPLPEYMPF